MACASKFRALSGAATWLLLSSVASIVWAKASLTSGFVTNVERRPRGVAGILSKSSISFSPSLSLMRCSAKVGIVDDDLDDGGQPVTVTSTANRKEQHVESLKRRLFDLSDRTNRGFRASAADRRRAGTIIYDLARFNPTPEPAKDYYDPPLPSSIRNDLATISGKWTLIYTDAPDITGLDSGNPLGTAKLGRIGQECSAPYIKNVIEWCRPDWAAGLPFSGSDQSRILQKVVTSATATPDKPCLVDLKVSGLELANGSGGGKDLVAGSDGNNVDFWNRVQTDGLPAGILSVNPIDLKGPFNPPFGQFEVLYLDDDLRVIRTSQNYLAANRRIKSIDEEWF